MGRPRRALRSLQPRPRGRSGGRGGPRRHRVLGADRRQVGEGGARTVAGANRRQPLRAARSRRHPAANRDGRARRVLRGRGRGGDRSRVVALRGRPPRACLRVGRAAAEELPRRRGLRAAAERPGRCRAARPRAVRRSRARTALRDRGDEARVRRYLRVRARRPAAGGSLRRRSTRRSSLARAARSGARSQPRPPPRRHHLPLRGGR